ncbi:MAG TPA: PA0069 family radical SAM protein [Pirellulales bacterium]|nr:PA0069 family radical SAM protein [Pirellulales bacterium]
MTNPSKPKGRGSPINPPNRFEKTHLAADFEQLRHDDEFLTDQARSTAEYLPDESKSIVSENDSPDIPFRYSVNPYRGCSHGCSYCYARPYHEFLGLSAGLDFETKILVKHDAPALLREFLSRASWKPEPITFSGVTDCYQPVERQFRLTRGCFEVASEARQPIAIITKNALILRDLDLLAEMGAARLVHANISVTTLDAELARAMEPRTSTPAARFKAMRALADAGIPVRVMVAPIIPGLTDHETPAVLETARQAGATAAGYVLLRLPLTVEPVFRAWLQENYPNKKERVEALIRSTRGGKLTDSHFGQRMRGQGNYAGQIARNFEVFSHRLGLDRRLPELDVTQFRPPRRASGQLQLF